MIRQQKRLAVRFGPIFSFLPILKINYVKFIERLPKVESLIELLKGCHCAVVLREIFSSFVN